MTLYLVELFSGTGSVGDAARVSYGDVVNLKHYSVDINPKYNPTTAVNLLEWDYKTALDAFLADYSVEEDFVIVWMSPPCTQYSIARSRAKTPRDLEGADALVERALEIKDYVNPNAWFLENPHGDARSALRLRPIMQPLEQYRHECTTATTANSFESEPTYGQTCPPYSNDVPNSTPAPM
jgi:site-specific DNA-cytosine methylase